MLTLNNKLKWHELQPDLLKFKHLFLSKFDWDPTCFYNIQPRLNSGIEDLLKHSTAKIPLMLVKCPEHVDYLSLIANSARQKNPDKIILGGNYNIQEDKISWQHASSIEDNFSTHGEIIYSEWSTPEQLFGCVRIFKDKILIEPGLVHRAHGGVLILALRTILDQPKIWFRLKKILIQKRFDWLSLTKKPLPVSIPSMPLDFKLIITGERQLLDEFREIEPTLASICIYSEFEEELEVLNEENVLIWCQWVTQIALKNHKAHISADFWPVLFQAAVRYTGNQQLLPLCPVWIEMQLDSSSQYCTSSELNGESLQRALLTREWQLNYLAVRLRESILIGQTIIQTEGKVIGQINGLSVIEIPGYPSILGEPLRISCVVHNGDGELIDVERKVDLGGNIHSKGMIIIQSWLIAALQLDSHLPFSISLVFEQTYLRIDGDSASLAGLCAIISALSCQPIDQQMAVTGSVDQFGNVQSIGSINEKIEGFFHICNQRQLTGSQGVIIPRSNLSNLCLQRDVIEAVHNGKFNIWMVSHVNDALPLLTGMKWNTDNEPSLLSKIKERIAKINNSKSYQRKTWSLPWKRWFK
ncbi:MAG: Lon protease family protein [Candidatus Dasytiphilus stammeri]